MQFTAVTRFTSRATAITIGGVIAMVGATGVAQAESPYNYVKPYRDYAALSPGVNDVEAIFTSTQPAPDPLNPFGNKIGIASYGDALLTSSPTGLSSVQDASQLFSDRVYPTKAPFNAGEADSTGVLIGVNDKTRTVKISLRLDSWGGTIVPLKNPSVQDGMLIASGPGAGTGNPNALFAFALDEVNVPG